MVSIMAHSPPASPPLPCINPPNSARPHSFPAIHSPFPLDLWRSFQQRFSMSPPVRTFLHLDIGEDLSDEEATFFLFLCRRRSGNPTPANVIIGVDPFSIEPSNSSEESWYLYNSKGPPYPNRSAIIETESGFWRTKDDCRILMNTTSVGRKTTMEFYKGKIPLGNRTRWMMHEYQLECKTLNGSNKEKDYNSLCKVFLQNDQTDYEEQHYSASANAVGECVMQLLPIFREPEERNSPPKDVRNRSLGQSTFSESLGASLNVNIVKDTNATCDFSIGDYLELNDFCSRETSSSSSDNSSHMSVNSYDYFDADALLWSIGDDGSLGEEEEQIDHMVNISTVAKSNQIVIRSPLPGLFHSNSNSNVVVEDSLPGNGISHQGLSVTNDELQHKTNDSKAGQSEGSQTNRAADSSRGGRSLQGNELKKVGKITKLGKKYCCFGSF